MEKKLKVLLSSPYGGVPGGISRWTGHIVSYFDSLQYKPVELDLVPMGRSRFVTIGMNWFKRLYLAWIDYREIFKNFHQSLKRKKYDIMHLTSSGSLSLLKDIYMLKCAKKYGCKTVIHFRFGRIPDVLKANNWEGKLIRKVVHIADSVIAIDQRTYTALRSIAGNKVCYLPNPVSNKVFDVLNSCSVESRLQNTLLFAGHVIPTKGVVELVKACKMVPNIKLRMVGHVQDAMRTELMAMADGDWLEIVGEEDYSDVIKDMLSCTLFILPTYTEGFPNVILESMACGCPIITTPVGAIPEMLQVSGKLPCGKVVEVKSVDQLSEAIKYYLSNYDEALAMGLRAKQRVIEMYSIDVVWNQMVAIWKDICK